MRYAIAIAALLLTLGLAACGQEEEEGAPTGSAGDVPFQTLVSGQQSGISLEEPAAFLIAGEEGWQELWARHSVIAIPEPEPPAVDFQRQAVIAVVDQNQPSGGYSLEVTRIAAEDGRLTVYATRRAPGPGCAATAVITQPYHWVLVEADRLGTPPAEPELVIATETYQC